MTIQATPAELHRWKSISQNRKDFLLTEASRATDPTTRQQYEKRAEIVQIEIDKWERELAAMATPKMVARRGAIDHLTELIAELDRHRQALVDQRAALQAELDQLAGEEETRTP